MYRCCDFLERASTFARSMRMRDFHLERHNSENSTGVYRNKFISTQKCGSWWMSIKTDAAWSLIGTAVKLGVISILQWFYKGAPIFLVFHDVMSTTSKNHFVVFLGLAVGLRMVGRSGEMFHTK